MPNYRIVHRSPDQGHRFSPRDTSPGRYSRATWHSGSRSVFIEAPSHTSPGTDVGSVFRHVRRPSHPSRQRISREMNAPIGLMQDAIGVLEGFFFAPPRRRPESVRNNSYPRTEIREPAAFVHESNEHTPRSRIRSSGESNLTADSRHSRRHEREFDDRSTPSRHSRAPRSIRTPSSSRRDRSPSHRRPDLRETYSNTGSTHSHRSRASQRPIVETIDQLEHEVQSKRRAVRGCRRQLEMALRDAVHSQTLQDLLDDLRRLETASVRAEDRLHDARQAQRNLREEDDDNYSHWSRSSRKQHGNLDDDDDDGWDFLHEPSANIFVDVGHDFFAFESHTMPRRSRPRRSATRDFFNASPTSSPVPPPRTARPRSSAPKSSIRPTRPVPATWLQPVEAQSLYATYNARWNALDPQNPDIPYPARGLRATALTARDTLAMPSMRPTSLARASNDAVMQANVQAFFLGAAGITPVFAEALETGIIDVTVDWARVTEGPRKALTEMLKKEKTRWHSDRLGRRNGGTSTINTALQQDERARTVFHAVCALMNKLEGK